MAALVFAVALSLAIIILTTLLVVQGYRQQFSRAETAAASAAHVVAVHTQWLTEASNQVLERIHDQLRTQSLVLALEPFGDIDEQLSGLPDHVRITVYGPHGNVRLSNSDMPLRPNIAQEDYFELLENGDQFTITPMLLDAGDEPPTFIIARRLETQGTFSGVAAITVSNELFSDVWQSLNLEPGSTISLIRDDGWLVARYPVADEPIDLSDYVLFTEHLPEADVGTYYTPASPVDGQARVVGYHRLEGSPLVAVAAISTETIVSRFWQNTALALVLIIPGLVGLVLALWWLTRILQQDRQTREQLAAAVEQNQMLFREIHHRVKNNLQAVSSLVQLQPVSPAVKQEMGRRIAAMVAVHEHIYRTDQFGTAEVSAYVEKLVDDIVTGFDTKAEVVTDIDKVHVHRDHLMPLGLIVNEALCNAIKYAFPDGRDGRIDVRLKADGPDRATLTIGDDGVGFDPESPSDGMGRRLVRGLVQQIEGTMHYANGGKGSTFVLTFPTVVPASAD